jgi:hypothetical protein
VVPTGGGSVEFILGITNGGSHGKNVSLSWDEAQISVKRENQNGTLDAGYAFTSGAGLTENFIVTYKVSGGTDEGTYPFHLDFTEGGTKSTVSASVKVTNEPIRKVSVSPERTDLQIQLNRVKKMDFTISNIGTVDDSFELLVRGSASPFMQLSASPLSIKRGGSGTATISFSAPEDGLVVGNYTYELQATSASDRDITAKASGIITVTSPEFGVFPETTNVSIYKDEFRDVMITFKSGLHARDASVRMTHNCPLSWISNANWTNGTIDVSVNTFYKDYVRITPSTNTYCTLTFIMECVDGTDIKKVVVYGISTDDEMQDLNQTQQLLASLFANTTSRVKAQSTQYNTTFIEKEILKSAQSYLDECNNQVISRNGDLALAACDTAEETIIHANHALDEVMISARKSSPAPITVFTVLGALLFVGSAFYLYKMFKEGEFKK